MVESSRVAGTSGPQCTHNVNGSRQIRQIQTANSNPRILSGSIVPSHELLPANLALPSVTVTAKVLSSSRSSRSMSSSRSVIEPKEPPAETARSSSSVVPSSSRTVWQSQTSRANWAPWFSTSYKDSCGAIPLQFSHLGMEAGALFGRENRLSVPDSFGRRRRSEGDYSSVDKCLLRPFPPRSLGTEFGRGRGWWSIAKNSVHNTSQDFQI